MSAYANLLGLYPTSKEKLKIILSKLEHEDKWSEILPWQPIPVHTVPRTIDYHDATIVAMLSLFQANYIHQPAYCSTLFMDLYHISDNNTYILKLEYLNSTNGRTTQSIQLPPCDNLMCLIDILNKWLENRLPSDNMKMECMPRRLNQGFDQLKYNI
ncbi:unnamed protein product [Rotaria magnacalcarata]|uniref:Uncharacterized protein n=1 Tax=Rotaria magnacalcarata TaxID=392030 RepID=A0A816Y7Y4_9BILA|nr:unnamed protein product [Rotaria magnacalcarata]